MGLFDIGRNWARRRELKQQWLLALKKMRGPGRGLDIPAHDVVAAVALQELLRAHPELTVQRFRDKVNLCYRRDLEAAIAAPTLQFLERGAFLAKPEDDLVTDAENREEELRAKGGLKKDDPANG